MWRPRARGGGEFVQVGNALLEIRDSRLYRQSFPTQEEIAAAVEVHQDTVSEWTKGFTEKLATDNSVNPPDFTPPLYNVWKQQDKSDGFQSLPFQPLFRQYAQILRHHGD
mgnify:CR=1 FL=1